MSEPAWQRPAPDPAADQRELLAEVRAVLARWPLSDEETLAWRQAASCRGVDPELFYPGRGVNPEPARALCRQCPVRAQCLAAALARNEKFGTWGGLTEVERRRVRRLVLVPEA